MARKSKKKNVNQAAAAPETAAPPAPAQAALEQKDSRASLSEVPAGAAPSREAISARAHQIWIEKGSPKPGTPIEDWLAAERELSRRRKS
jgi:hypothetical protein